MQVIPEETARERVSLERAIDAVEAVFVALERGEAALFPVVMGANSDGAGRFGVKSGRIASKALLGMKIGTYWPGNVAKGLESHGSTTFLLDDATGFPRAVVGASHLTALRTAAADAVAIRRLAKADAAVLAVVGAGHQAWYDLKAACLVRPIREVRVWSRTAPQAERFAARACRELGLDCRALPLADAVGGADIVICATAAGEPLVQPQWVKPGAHVSAMGADSVGKQELSPQLVATARRFADVVAQSISIGEFQSAVRAGLIEAADISTLGSALLDPDFRRRDDEITIFDSSGMALQDLAMAELALESN